MLMACDSGAAKCRRTSGEGTEPHLPSTPWVTRGNSLSKLLQNVSVSHLQPSRHQLRTALTGRRAEQESQFCPPRNLRQKVLLLPACAVCPATASWARLSLTFVALNPVGVPNLVQLLPGPTFDTVGTKIIHPNSHWVTPAMRVRAEAFADSFFTRFHKKVAFNDASLLFGGKFDIHQQWASDDPECLRLGGQLNGCHAGHRRGLDVDLRTNNLTVNQIKAAKELWETVSGREIFPHPDHYHLPYRP